MGKAQVVCTKCKRPKEVGEKYWILDVCPTCSKGGDKYLFGAVASQKVQRMECPVCRDGVDLGKEYTPSLGRLCDEHEDELVVMAREGGL